MTYRGRFAPSPTGELHLGSLTTALASYLQAKYHHGIWLIRIDDIDTPRITKGSADSIITMLDKYGMQPDEPIAYQSTHLPFYQQALEQLQHMRTAYSCGCSRAELNADGSYPGTCRHGLPKGKYARSVRVHAPQQALAFNDLIAGPQSDDIQHNGGDFVIHRADGVFAYQLCAAIDDAAPNITEVVRGADLLPSTGRQQYLQQLLGLTSPQYAHIPVVNGRDGRKLSKHHADAPLAYQQPLEAMRAALNHLQHPAPAYIQTFDGLLSWALKCWDIRRLTQH